MEALIQPSLAALELGVPWGKEGCMGAKGLSLPGAAAPGAGRLPKRVFSPASREWQGSGRLQDISKRRVRWQGPLPPGGFGGRRCGL